MCTRAEVSELLGEPKVDHVKLIAMTADSHEEVVRLDVTVDETLAVDELYAAQHLICGQRDGSRML